MTGTEAATDAPDGEPYGGVLGAFPYAFRASGSWLFRSYAVLGGLLALALTAMFLISLLLVIADTAAAPGGTVLVVRAFVVVVGLAVVAPLLAPVLFVARRHRRAESDARYDAALAAAGYLFVLSLYLAVVISAPPAYRGSPSGALAPAVAFLYGLPALAGLVPPALAGLLMWLAHRRLR